MDRETLIAIDPGRRKCGLVVIGKENDLLEKKVIPTSELCGMLAELIKKYRPDKVLMGSGAHGRKLKIEVEPVLGKIPLSLVDERHSTEIGRAHV